MGATNHYEVDPLTTWVIADTHFGHAKIVEYCGRPSDHDARMLKAWQEQVGKEDLILHLGDLILSRDPGLREEVRNLPGKKWLMRGNHDHKTRVSQFRDLGFEVVWDIVLHVGEIVLRCSHRPPAGGYVKNMDWRLHGHVHERLPPFRMVGRSLFINCSVEVWDYAPIRLDRLIRLGRQWRKDLLERTYREPRGGPRRQPQVVSGLARTTAHSCLQEGGHEGHSSSAGS